ncbi:MAG: 16S rRNA (guanine(966)-N(2))-methyltransferase RsmD [Clostridiales bacterium]|nr:16S rRNA (guanine(966)-N(2))-methyltransferase RsmD [Clostridiales bacterium]
MRIVGGKYGGRVLSGFEGKDIRPTSDKARESLFNILRNRIYGSNFLDLFCGTGAIGIEAISHGAKTVTFNDIERKSLAVLKSNLEKLKVTEDYKITNFDALSFLMRSGPVYDIIYIDPPYKMDIYDKLLKLSVNALNDGGIVIFESEQPFDGQVDGLIKYDERKYGRARLTFYKKGE